MIKKEDEEEFNSDLFEHYQFKADKGQDPLRVDKFLMNRIENSTRNKIQQAAKDGFIFVNGNNVKSNYKVKPGDIAKVMFSHPSYENLSTIAFPMPFVPPVITIVFILIFLK